MTTNDRKTQWRNQTITGLIGAALLAGLFAAGCSSAVASSGRQANTAAVAAGDSANGQQLFKQNCIICHATGIDPTHAAGYVQNGGNGMPAFPQLTDQDIADITAYLKTLK